MVKPHGEITLDAITHCSDEELAALIRESPRLEQHAGIALLSDRYLAKCYSAETVEDAVKATDLAIRLGIRAPRLLRFVPDGNTGFAVMERIRGPTVEDAWLSLGWFASLRLALQLRSFVLKMRSITSTIGGSLATGNCRSFWLDDCFGLPPRASNEDISAFLTFWAGFVSVRHELKKGDHSSAPRGPPAIQIAEMVFTHHDLAPRNLMVDAAGDIWLLDWDYSGFYPTCFEYASMNNFNMPRNWGLLPQMRWYLFAWIAAGRFDKEERLLRRIRYNFQRFGAGRRFSIEQNGTKASRKMAPSPSASESSTSD